MQVIGERGRFDKDVRWTGVMAANLPGGDFTIIEEGLPGRTTVFDDPIEGAHKNGMRTLRAVLESHREIDLVIVMLGTNDLKHRFSVTAADIATGAEKLVIEARDALDGCLQVQEALFHDACCDLGAHARGERCFVDDHAAPGLLDRLSNGVHIEGVDRTKVDEFDRDVLWHVVHGLEALEDWCAPSHDGEVVAFGEDLCLAQWDLVHLIGDFFLE